MGDPIFSECEVSLREIHLLTQRVLARTLRLDIQ